MISKCDLSWEVPKYSVPSPPQGGPSLSCIHVLTHLLPGEPLALFEEDSQNQTLNQSLSQTKGFVSWFSSMAWKAEWPVS